MSEVLNTYGDFKKGGRPTLEDIHGGVFDDNPRSHDNGITICMNAYQWMWIYICYTAFELSKEGYDKTLSYKGFEKALENVAHEMYRNGLYLHHISPSDEYNVISDVAMNQIKPRSPNIRSKSSRIN